MERLSCQRAVLVQFEQLTVELIRAALGDNFHHSGTAVFRIRVCCADLDFLNGRNRLRQSLEFIGVTLRSAHTVDEVVDRTSGNSVNACIALALTTEACRYDTWRKVQNVSKIAILKWKRHDSGSFFYICD